MEEPDIPILRRAYDLYRTFHGLRSLVSKADRYTLWQRAENLILDVLEGILLASQLPKSAKLPPLEKVSVKLNLLRLFLRLTKDTKALELKKILQVQEIIDEIGRMLGGWIKAAKEDNGKLSPGSKIELRERERELMPCPRRKFREAASHRLTFGLSSQLLLTFTRPSLTVSSAWLPSGSALLPIPVQGHRKSRITAL